MTGTGTNGRFANSGVIASAGGTVRLDGSGLGTSASGYSDVTGPLALGPGQTTVRIDAPAGRGARLAFASLTSSPTGTVRFESNSLGVSTLDTAGAANVAFATVPTLVGTTSAYGPAVTDLRILPNGVGGPAGGAATTLVTYDTTTNSVRGLADTNYATAFGTPTDNVSLGAATVLAGPTTANSLRLTGTGAVDRGANALTLTSGALLVTAANTTLAGTGPLNFGAGGTATGHVASSSGLTVNGPVAAANLSVSATAAAGQPVVFGGPVALGNGGVLAVNSGLTRIAATGSVTAADGNLTVQVGRGAALDLPGGFTVSTGRTLTGSGTVTGTVTVSGTAAVPGVLVPSALAGPTATGASPGTLTVGNMVWQPNGAYRWYLNSAQAGSYTHSQLAGAAGATLDLSGLSAANRFTIVPDSLALSNADGPVYDFDRTQSYAWTIATFPGGITGFDANAFTVSVAEFANALQPGDAFTVSRTGNSLVLVFTPVPEPAGLLLAAAAAGWAARRRWRV